MKIKENQYFKIARLDGWDWYTGNTINYRENVGKTVSVPNFVKTDDYRLCSQQVLHASKDVFDALSYCSRLPLSIYVIEGIPVVKDSNKAGFTKFDIVKEIPQNKIGTLLKFKYEEVLKPLDPRTITPVLDNTTMQIFKVWGSVWGSVWDSVRDSVWDSVWGSVWDSVWDSVWGSVWGSVRGSVRDSVRDQFGAYAGTLFPSVKKWNYLGNTVTKYPYNEGVELLKRGVVASYDQYNKDWFLLGNQKMEILWKGKLEEIK